MNKNQPTEKISRTYCGCIPKGSDVDKDWQVVLNPTLCSFSHVLSGHGNQSSLGKPVSEQTYLRIKPLYNQPLLLFPFPLNCFVHNSCHIFCCMCKEWDIRKCSCSFSLLCFYLANKSSQHILIFDQQENMLRLHHYQNSIHCQCGRK